jgi:hypothetical protein
VLQLEDMANRKIKHRHPISLKEKVFQIWLHNEGNITATARICKNRLGVEVSVPTIGRWRDQYDWEAKQAIYNNELQRMFRMSDDPVLQQLAMDDLETARVLTEIQHIMRDVMKHPKKYGLYPKNINEVVTLMKYARDERERILNKAKVNTGQPQQPALPQGNVTYYDQRKIELKGQFDQLPAEEQRQIIDGVARVKALAPKAAQRARREAFEEEDDES